MTEPAGAAGSAPAPRDVASAPVDAATLGPDLVPAPPALGSGAVEQAHAILSTLAALGVRELVIAPGSRSAPFPYALQQHGLAARLRAHVRIDERAAAFTALGLSRADPRRPATVVTTSGTATAHLHAAVLEAHHARVPLIMLTADRPAELRDVGANQATHQAGIYGDAVRFAADLPAPTAGGATAVELRTAVTTLARAYAAATGPHPGPVHLNIGLRDPLVPGEPRYDAPRDGIVLTRRVPPGPPAPVEVTLPERTVVVAGDGAGPVAAELAAAHHLPLLAEPSSGARHGAAVIPHPVSVLRETMADTAHPLRPEAAIVLGHPTLSRPVVTQLLGARDVEVTVVDHTASWPDAVRRARLVVPAIRPRVDVGTLAARRAYLAAWQQAGRAAGEAAGAAELAWQVRAALHVWDATGPDDVLVLGSSSVVRDLEEHAGPARGTVHANRGLAGIDGLVSTAMGVALGRIPERPGRVRAVIGDLTAIHDLSGLVIGPDEPLAPLDVIVLDDGGGRIFSGLEHRAAPPAVLRRFFTTPHGVDLAGAARALGWEAHRVDAEELPAALAVPGAPRTERPRRRILVVSS